MPGRPYGVPAGWELRSGLPPPVDTVLMAMRPASAGGVACLAGRPYVPVIAGRPKVALTIIVDPPPSASDEDIGPLIARGLFGVTVSVTPTSESLDELGRNGVEDPAPLFAQSATFRLTDTDTGGEVAVGKAAGSELTAALTGPLTSDRTRSFLDALDGRRSGLLVEVDVAYRDAPIESTIELSGLWAKVHDLLAKSADKADELSQSELREAIAEALETGALRARSRGSTPVQQTTPVGVDAAFGAFLTTASVVVDRLTSDLASDDEANRYRLRRRPSELMPISFSGTVTTASMVQLEQSAPLEDLVALGDAVSLDDLVRVVTVSSVGELLPVRQRRAARGMRSSRGRGSPRVLAVIRRGRRDDVGVAATLASAKLLTSPASIATLTYFAADVVAVAEPTPESLPIVDDPNAPIFRDRVDSALRWYVPEFALRMPASDESPESSPFLFRVSRSGIVTGSGNAALGLDAAIRLTAEPRMSDASRAALEAEGNPTSRAVPLSGLSAALEIPYRVSGSGELATQALAAEVVVANDGAITATIRALDDWARLAYGALSTPGFQATPPRLMVSFSFEALSTSPAPGPIEVPLIMKKIAVLPIDPVFVRGLPNGPDAWYSTREMAIHARGTRIRLEPDGNGSRSARAVRPVAKVARAGLKVHGSALAAIALAPNALVAPALVKVPPLVVLPPTVEPEVTFTRGTVGRAVRTDAVVSCDSFGTLYRQTAEAGDVAIGCQDALRLGEAPLKLYTELPELAQPGFRLFESRQQPGHFMVLPAAFRITRLGPDEPEDRRYRPAILLHATLGKEPADHRYVLVATLEPDLPEHAIARLRSTLTDRVPDGTDVVLRLPLEPSVQAQLTYAWTLPDEVAEPDVLETWDGFQVTITSNLADALLVNQLVETSGLTGTAAFELPDGSKLSSSLVMDTRITGPWPSGPISVDLAGQKATLTNHSERSADIFEVLVAEGADLRSVPSDITLDPAASAEVSVGAADRAWPVYRLRAGPLQIKELNVFVDDVTTNVVFVNLVNYGNHELLRLDLQVRIAGDPEGTAEDLPIEEGQTGELQLTLPLTAYLEPPTVEFRAQKTFANGDSSATPWIPWELAERGIVVSLTWELID